MNSFLPAVTALFVVVEPLGAVPTFVAMTASLAPSAAQRVAARATLVGALVLVAVALIGKQALDLLGVRLDAFRTAGGLLLLLTALDMLRGHQAACRCGPNESTAQGDIAVVPLAIPLLAGPGAMATTMLLLFPATGAPTPLAVVLLAIGLTFLVSFLVLRVASRFNDLLGAAGVSLLQRLLGLVLAAMTLQAVFQGVKLLLQG